MVASLMESVVTIIFYRTSNTFLQVYRIGQPDTNCSYRARNALDSLLQGQEPRHVH